ncbi:23S rRNA (pseudouridine(1915)-N(3))-methyltransferase RlmH [Defluviitalea raffinosedens]|uniref:Ribosomal RNA large subunit methyltransferase H n=1 Tax=Defluviitalea raffinosedens TaxID=1450156 RepID=A0A7C8HFE9_9FIRM|nr:23S rRNA (pseudouridine(1915)-N(3))-methyltransferase RlmH [Defluviitalea raffinosedens]KAE9635662.1 50S rRNA methyltransferase [Defluviitalea raffinosedens]MBM7684588.1 23S rRNA (pseudouridine1915-N3)-methyltransferase [Defluviitalea raffinosedens]
MNYKIYVVGNKIQKFYTDGIKEYVKRLSRYCKPSLVPVKNEEDLLKKLSPKSYKILIASYGAQLSSEELASKINHLGVSGKSDIAIIIGSTKANYDECLAISPMEMDLGLTATILFEQIYRAYRIINNEPYHK